MILQAPRKTVPLTVPPTVPLENAVFYCDIPKSGTVARPARSGAYMRVRARARTYIYISEYRDKACRFSVIPRNNKHNLAARKAARCGTKLGSPSRETVPLFVPLRRIA